ncbi:ABC transporter substrate-binding protein [Mesorhizobium australicum]|uniref:ABC-type nitrate/sulfonate/bicarbonate transport system, substrate-binding protein n=1 Tax=Mesorhizobium australicum TaxID=536018 RepID=A0A1X7PS40_9HYPH|nr:ABC transporter substrate-binding protein [Mesorhizobium australicum]SMH54127.1 ABC-type nitrate/sulfonate/bicarbonate transport system, substrate-binding protein [Mesorhizobium australicum]
MFVKLKMAAIAAALTFSFGLGGWQAAAEEQTITVATPGAALHFYPFYVAEAAGLFKKDGIAIQWVDVGAGSRQIAAVASRSADFAVVGMQPSISARENGADLVAVSGLFNAYPIQLVLSKAAMEKTGITAGMGIDDVVSRLKNVTIAVTGIGSTTDVLLRSWLVKRGVKPDEAITIQPLGNPGAMFAAFEQGAIDGVMLGAPWPEKAEADGVGTIIVDPLKGGIPELEGVPYTAIIAAGSLVKEKPEVVGSVVHALTEAMKLTAAEPDKVGEMLKSYFPDTDEAIYKAFEPRYRGKSSATPVISKEEYQKLLDWISITSDKPVTVTFEQFVDNQFADKAAAEVLK